MMRLAAASTRVVAAAAGGVQRPAAPTVVAAAAAAAASRGGVAVPAAATTAVAAGAGGAATSRANDVKRVGVIGAGQMGTGIAKVAAHQGGREVVLLDVDAARGAAAQTFIAKLLAKDVAKERLGEAESAAVAARVSTTTELRDLAECDIVIEAAPENTELKQKIFRDLADVCKPEAILATNTSSISITKIASVVPNPENVIGCHFMNPVPVMKLVEIIPGMATSEETQATTVDLVQQMGKTTTESRDIPGFIANRILMPYINEAFHALYEGIGTPEHIDTTMKLGTNVPMGPLVLADFIGIDTCVAILNVLNQELGDRYKPSPLMVKYVEAGWVGKKAGRGVYKY